MSAPALAPGSGASPALSLWTILAWAVGGVSGGLMISAFGLLNTVLPQGYGIDPVIIGWAVALPRLVDALIDPILGHLSDTTRTRWGRRKPFIALGAGVGAVLLMALWWIDPAWSRPVQFAYLLTLSVVFYATWGLFAMAHTALGYELTDDYRERNRIAAIANAFNGVVFVIAGWTYWVALRPALGGPISGMRWVAAGMACLVILGALGPLLGVRERFTAAPRKAHVPVLRALGESLRNRPFVILLAARVVASLGGMVGSAATFIAVYYVAAGDQSLAAGIGGIIQVLALGMNLLAIPLIPYASRWIDKRTALRLFYVIAVISAVMTPFIMTPTMPYLQLLPVLLLTPLRVVCDAFVAAIYPDICDCDELEHGSRREGLFTAVQGFVTKLESSILAVVGGYLVSWSGFDPTAKIQTDQVLTALMWLAWTPGILAAFIALAIAWRFPLGEAEMREVRSRLAERRAKA